MKTNNLFRIALFAAFVTFSVVACKKDNSANNDGNTSASSVQTAADDQTMASNEDEAVTNDADAALSANVSIAGSSINSTVKAGGSVLGGGSIEICDATISFDTANATRTVTITYNGSNCWGNRTRTGTVTISIPQGVHWKDEGAVVTINVDLTISRKRDGKSLVIKGTKTITNTSGGLLIDLATLLQVTHDISSAFTLTFDNGSQRSWNVSKHRVFSWGTGINDNGINITTTGTHSDGTNSDIAEWGTNRFGVAFVSRITAPKTIAQSCDFRLTGGENTITRGDHITSVITYGLDANGNATTCPGTGFYYAKLVWTNSATNKTYTFIFPY